MPPDLPSLKSEPLLYFLLHSGVFVLGLGLLFFLLGLWFGAATWGRYRRQNRLLQEESETQLEEIAGLKRKLAEQTVSPGTAALHAPAPALLTEVLPSVSQIFPERAPQPPPAAAAKPTPATTSAAPPASAPVTASTTRIPIIPAPAPAPATPADAKPSPLATRRLPVIPASAPASKPAEAPRFPPAPAAETLVPPPATALDFPPAPESHFPTIPDLPESPWPHREFIPEPLFARVRLRPPAPAKPAPTPQPLAEPETAVEPFSFLLPDEAEDAGAPPSVSPWTALTPTQAPASQPVSRPETDDDDAPGDFLLGGSALSFIIDPDSTAQVAPVSAPPSVIPENDPALGLIFKEAPTETDDLTRIPGISPALQHRLQEMGIYKFQQIAEWSPSQMHEFSHRLAFKDRIEREHWIENARRLRDSSP